MNEKTFYDMMKGGKTLKEIMAEVEAAAKRVEEEKAAEQKKQAEREDLAKRGQAIADMATRMINGKLTEDDVAEVMRAYVAQTVTDIPKDLIDTFMDVDVIKSLLTDMVDSIGAVGKLAAALGLDMNSADWQEAANRAKKELGIGKSKSEEEPVATMPKERKVSINVKSESDDDIIKQFLNSLKI